MDTPRTGSKLETALRTSKRPLVYVISLTARCNLRCRYCYVESGAGSVRWTTVRQAVDLAVGLKHDPLIFAFFGGEPLLEWDLLKRTVAYAGKQNRKARFNIATNITLVNGKVVEYFRAHGFSPTLSFDGVAPANDRNRVFRNNAGTFSTIDRKLELFRDYPHKMHLMFTFTPQTVRYLEASVRYALDKGLGGARINLMPAISGYVWTEAGYRAFERQLFILAEMFLERYARGSLLNICSNEDVPMDHHLLNLARPGPGEASFCAAGRNILAVSTEGGLYPCYVLAGLPRERSRNWLLGNVKDGIVHPERALHFGGPGGNSCMSCLAWNAAGGGSPQEPLPEYRRFYSVWLKVSRYVNLRVQASPLKAGISRKDR